MSDLYVQDVVFQGTTPVLLARIYGQSPAKVPIHQADLTAIEYTSRDAEALEIEIAGGDLVIAGVITDTLEPWQKDSIGKNFGFPLPKEAIPDGDREYVVFVNLIFQGTPAPEATLEYRLKTRQRVVRA